MKTSIVPISFGPLGTANTLYCRAVGVADNSGRLFYLYWFAKDTVTVTETETTNEDGTVSTTPTENTTSETIVQPANVAMTPEQWAAWPEGDSPADDETYQLACVAELVGAEIPA